MQNTSLKAQDVTTFDPDTLTQAEQYKLLVGSVVPRPIALVTTIGEHGPNAAPFSFFNVLSVKPPLLLLSIGMRGNDIEKDTTRNLRECGELVIHIVDEDNAEKMNLCSAPHPPSVNELEVAGFECGPSDLVKPPRILDCPVAFECKLESLTPYGEVPYHLVIARVVRMHFRSDTVNSVHHVNLSALNPVGRVPGPGMYTRVTDLFQLPSLL